jgi:hypothetical protein
MFYKNPSFCVRVTQKSDMGTTRTVLENSHLSRPFRIGPVPPKGVCGRLFAWWGNIHRLHRAAMLCCTLALFTRQFIPLSLTTAGCGFMGFSYPLLGDALAARLLEIGPSVVSNCRSGVICEC